MGKMDKIFNELEQIVGNRVRMNASDLCCYSADASQIRGMPDFVLFPISVEEVSEIMKIANKYNINVTARGAGTGLAGGAVPVKGGIVLDMTKMDKILKIDIENLLVVVEPGVVQVDLNEALKPYGFFFPPDPGSFATCTVGGQIANNASGMRCVKYGTVKNYVLNLEVIMADGTLMNTGSECQKTSSGYDLSRLFVGSEGTLGIITKATLKIMPIPECRKLVMVSFPSSEIAGKSVSTVFSAGVMPSACEILDKTSVDVLLKLDPNVILPKDGDVIIFEVDGSKEAVDSAADKLKETLTPFASSILVTDDPDEMKKIWAARSLVGAAVSKLDPTKTRIYVGEDLGVPIKKLPEMIKKVYEVTDKEGLLPMIYGHIGDGTIHVGQFIDVLDQNDWDKLNRAADALHLAAIEIGGTVSSEHGIGAARGKYLKTQCGNSFNAMKSIKNALDPKGILNPGKLGFD